MKKKKIALLPGDGIGPEVTEQAKKVLESIGEISKIDFEFKEGLIGAVAIDAVGDPFPRETEELCLNSDAILFGAIGHPKYDNDPTVEVRPEQGLLRMRKQLGLYANIRPVKSYDILNEVSPLKAHLIKDVDLVVFRELTGGIYFGERDKTDNDAFDTCRYSIHEIRRISKLAFKAAKKRRKKVTLVDKANVLATSQLWREAVQELAADYSDIELEFMYVDTAAMKIIQDPKNFDVILTENMFGDILSDEASVLTGSLGMLPSASIGSKIALYEPIHGSYPEVAGQNRANPIAAILSAGMLLDYSFGMVNERRIIQKVIDDALTNGEVTEDLTQGKAISTSQFGDKIVERIKQKKFNLQG
jgi:3-isopropylmalate dehydrogenase